MHPHETHSFMQCGACHGPQAPPEAKAAYSMSHDTCIQCHEDSISDVNECGICHKAATVSETKYEDPARGPFVHAMWLMPWPTGAPCGEGRVA